MPRDSGYHAAVVLKCCSGAFCNYGCGWRRRRMNITVATVQSNSDVGSLSPSFRQRKWPTLCHPSVPKLHWLVILLGGLSCRVLSGPFNEAQRLWILISEQPGQAPTCLMDRDASVTRGGGQGTCRALAGLQSLLDSKECQCPGWSLRH